MFVLILIHVHSKIDIWSRLLFLVSLPTIKLDWKSTGNRLAGDDSGPKGSWRISVRWSRLPLIDSCCYTHWSLCFFICSYFLCLAFTRYRFLAEGASVSVSLQTKNDFSSHWAFLVVSVKSSWPGSAVWHCKQQLPLWRCQCPSFIITSVVWSRMGYHLHRLDLAVCVILNGSLRDFSNFILLLGLIPRLW